MSMSNRSTSYKRSFHEAVPSKGGADVRIVQGDDEDLPEESTETDNSLNVTYKAAFDEGWNACLQEQQAHIEELRQQTQSLAEELAEALNTRFQELEKQVKKEITEVAMGAAEVVLRSKPVAPHVIQSALAEALNDPVFRSENIVIELSEEDSRNLSSSDVPALPSQCKTVLNSSLERGDVRVYAEERLMDGRLKQRLNKVKELIESKFYEDDQQSEDSSA
mgnify:CR=1 FL=1